jgi:hypothetical protein
MRSNEPRKNALNSLRLDHHRHRHNHRPTFHAVLTDDDLSPPGTTAAAKKAKGHRKKQPGKRG